MWLEDLADEPDPAAALVADGVVTRAQIDAALRYRAAYPDEIAALLAGTAPVDEAGVRSAGSAVKGLGEYRHPGVAPTLLRFAKRDATYTVEAEASEALGRQSPSEEIVEVRTTRT